MGQAIKTIVFVSIGAAPGLLLAWFIGRHAAGFVPAFVVAIFLGALVGGLLSLPQVNAGNVLRGLLGFVVAHNVPGGSGLLAKMLDDDHPAGDAGPSLAASRFARSGAPRTLEEFRRQHVAAIEEEHDAAEIVDPSQAAVIKKLATFSLAAEIGAAEGDLLCQVDDVAGCDVQWHWLNIPAADYTYRLHQPSSGRTWAATASGAPLGVNLGVSAEWLAAQVEQDACDFDVLEKLWEMGNWPLLQRAAEGMFHRLESADYHPPVNLYLGAALYEQGEKDRARGLLSDYYRHYADDFVLSFRALAAYYLGLEAFEQNDRGGGAALLQEAFECWEHDRFADALERLAGTRPQPEPALWKGRQLSLDYELRPLGDSRGGPVVRLADALRGMSNHQVTSLCLLGGYRANGPYARFMRSYRRWYTFFPHYFAWMHVITSNPTPPEDGEELLEPEHNAIAAGVPIRVIYDEDGSVNGAVGAEVSPFLLFIDHNANVLAEGMLDDVELWQLLETLAARA